MNYQNINTQEIKTYVEIKNENKNISYPKAGATMLGDEWHIIIDSPHPPYDVDSEAVREIAPINYVQIWEVYELSQAEIDAIVAQKEQEAEDRGWDEYKRDEDSHEKQLWKDAGKPVYTP